MTDGPSAPGSELPSYQPTVVYSLGTPIDLSGFKLSISNEVSIESFGILSRFGFDACSTYGYEGVVVGALSK